jgi:transketolase
VHGAPLGAEDIKSVKSKFGFDEKKSFFIPEDVKATYAKKTAQGEAHEAAWNKLFASYEAKYPKEAKEITRRLAGKLPEGWEKQLPEYKVGDKAAASRSTSGATLNALAKVCTELIGGSADLTPSNKTQLKCSHDFQKATPDGRYLRFGVREHGMGAIGNGLQAYGGFIPFTATFLTFIEYMFPAVRLAALSGHQHIFIMTHDSIGLGEDGPTHQPIEQVNLCRATPNLLMFRPCDGNEVSGAYQVAMQATTTPSVLALSRQNLPVITNTAANKVQKGAYTVLETKAKPDVVLVATGRSFSVLFGILFRRFFRMLCRLFPPPDFVGRKKQQKMCRFRGVVLCRCGQDSVVGRH